MWQERNWFRRTGNNINICMRTAGDRTILLLLLMQVDAPVGSVPQLRALGDTSTVATVAVGPCGRGREM
jgi:hypothetical protein